MGGWGKGGWWQICSKHSQLWKKSSMHLQEQSGCLLLTEVSQSRRSIWQTMLWTYDGMIWDCHKLHRPVGKKIPQHHLPNWWSTNYKILSELFIPCYNNQRIHKNGGVQTSNNKCSNVKRKRKKKTKAVITKSTDILVSHIKMSAWSETGALNNLN